MGIQRYVQADRSKISACHGALHLSQVSLVLPWMPGCTCHVSVTIHHLLAYFYICRDDRKLARLVKQFTLIDEGEAKACAEAVGQMTAVGSSSRTMKSLGVSNDDAAVDEPILLIFKPVQPESEDAAVDEPILLILKPVM